MSLDLLLDLQLATEAQNLPSQSDFELWPALP